jgi:hypothetical protein
VWRHSGVECRLCDGQLVEGEIGSANGSSDDEQEQLNEGLSALGMLNSDSDKLLLFCALG